MKIFGIISDQRAQFSKSPHMHGSVMRSRGIDGVYIPFRVKDHLLGEAINGVRGLGIDGVNVTVPYKRLVMPFLDDMLEDAATIGAVNTIVVQNDRLIGHNTDAKGFTKSIEELGMNLADKSVILFGAGGAARAAIYGLTRSSVSCLRVIARDQGAAQRLCSELGGEAHGLELLDRKDLEADLVINCASVSSPTEAPDLAQRLDRATIESSLVMDMNYGREENLWERLALRSSARFSDGLRMLACQAALSFRLWTGIDVDWTEYMEALVNEDG
jgi:shikimate dehydrogenase